MKTYRVIAAGLAAALAFASPSLVGRAQTGAAPAGPFDSLHWRPIGPASMSGRISDIAVYEANPNIWYVGSAHGGVWRTTNNGTTFEAQFQDHGLMSIGDIAVSQSNPDLLYVGTGESNNRQSTSWGDGVYKSVDGGKTYANVGLKASKHISRIIIDPRNNDVVWVAAAGPLFGPGGERGVFKTTDGGKTWKQTLKVDDDTGANDLAIDPANDQILYASSYQRRRTACCMNGGGPGSGIWKSTDGGEVWTRLKTGLPDGSLGRIALDVYRRHPNVLYALIEGPAAGRGGGAAAAGAGGAAAAGGAGAAGGRGAGRGAAGAEAAPAGNPDEAPQQFGGGRGLATSVDASATGLYRSDDSGTTWRKVNNNNVRPMYFSQVRIDPNDDDVIVMGGVDLQLSTDGGKSINTAAASAIHSDHHAIWIDPHNSSHMLIGNDGGLAQTFDQAKTWTFFPNLPVGLFYHVSLDSSTPFNICGGMQDNYDWCGPSQVRGAAGIANFEWETIQGGDGFVVLQDPKDNRVIYSESQDGNVIRVDRVTGETISIRPQPPAGQPPYRFQWDTPIVISPHDPATVYLGAQKVLKAPDRGLTFSEISPDLTTGEDSDREQIVTMGLKGSDITIAKNDGIVAYGTIVALAESPKTAGVLYAGTDDGRLQVTRDGGKNWNDVYQKLPGAPKGGYVSRVAPSRYESGTAYVTIDNHRLNDYDTYIYATKDFGQTWASLNGGLKGDVIKCITEDQRNPDVLYAGAETGLFVSTDRGASWSRPKWNLPTVRVDEVVQHPRDNAIVLATHGRAIWVLDHAEPIQEYAAAKNTDAKLFTPPPASMYRRPARDRNYEFWGNQVFYGENPPQSAVVSYFVKSKPTDVKLKISDTAGRELREIAIPSNAVKAGINSACWDLRVQPIPAPQGAPGGRGARGAQGEGAAPTPAADLFGYGCDSGGGGGGGGGGRGGGGGATPGPMVLGGSYTVALAVDGKTIDSKPLKVVGDPEVVLTEAQRKQLFDMAMDMHDLQKRASQAAAGVASLNRQIAQLAGDVAAKSDIPADVKSAFDSLKTDTAAMLTKLPPGAAGFGRGGGGGGRGNDPSLTGKIGQAKNGMMGGMWPTSVTMKAYADSKTDAPKVLADANALFAKSAAVSASLAAFNLKLDAPKPVDVGTSPKKKATQQ
ncbi:MAG TPA: hypothetical protein VGI12_19165 [Vicinamibacterales bacterium]|jgi:photosystem II stability/assembly factor-like uncharacterized protein